MNESAVIHEYLLDFILEFIQKENFAYFRAPEVDVKVEGGEGEKEGAGNVRRQTGYNMIYMIDSLLVRCGCLS